MSNEPPFFYPGGEYLDPKWTLIQEFIMKLAEGEYKFDLPEDLGEDHIDSVLLALRMMGETLEGKERQLLASGAVAALEQALVYLNEEGKVQKYNAKALLLLGSGLAIGMHITSVLQAADFVQEWKENCEGSMPSVYWKTHVNGAQAFYMEVIRMDTETGTGYKGFLLSLLKG